MAGVPARTVLAALLAGVFAGIPASASDKEVQVELTGRTEPSCAADSEPPPPISAKIRHCNQRICGGASCSFAIGAWEI